MSAVGVIFDLDGTLADTLVDLCASLNAAMALRGLPPCTEEECRQKVGGGARELVRRALPRGAEEEVDPVLAAFRAHYLEHLLDRTVLYPGIPALLDHLSARGVKLGIWSNKPQEMTDMVAAGLLGGWRFEVIHGQRAGVAPKPSPEAREALLAGMGLGIRALAMVGDSEADLAAAKNAGFTPFIVGWGLRSAEELRAAGAERIAHSPEALEATLWAWAEHV